MVDIDRVLISVESVREKLLASVNQTWQQDVEQQLSREHDRYASYDDEQKFKLFLEYILHTDMRHYWKAHGDSEQPWFVQVEQVQDISQPVKRRLSRPDTEETTRSSKRMLKMVLFDGSLFMMQSSCCLHACIEVAPDGCAGRKHHIGIEHSSLGFGWPRLGSKLVIDDGLVTKNGVLMLTPVTCGFLGGSVKEFEEHQKLVDTVVQEPLYGRRGPPLKLEEYKKTLKDKIDRLAGTSHEEQDKGDVPTSAVPTEDGDVYVIPSDSDDDWDIEAILEKKRTRADAPVVLEEKKNDTPVVQVDDSLASTLREMKRRKEMRAEQQKSSL